jgi:hypothetical protein
MATRTRVHVNQAAIQSLFVPGGQIDRYGRTRISRGITDDIHSFTSKHRRTGELHASFRSRSETKKNGVTFTVYSTEPAKARYLEFGTKNQIGARVMYRGLPAGAPEAGRFKWSIGRIVFNPAGTGAYHFMSKALDRVLRKHRLV